MKPYYRLITMLSVLFATHSNAQVVLSIDSALVLTKMNSSLLKREKQKLHLYEADVITAGLRPNLIFNQQSLQLTDLNYSPNHSYNYLDNHNRQIWYQLTKPFQLANLRRDKISFSTLALGVQQRKYYEIERNLYFEVANEWLNLWYLKEQVTILKDLKGNADTLVKITENQLKNGMISSSDLLRVQMLSEQYDVELKNLETEYKNNIRILKSKTGQRDSIEIKETDFFNKGYSFNNLDTLVNIALEKRADLKTAWASFDMYKSNIKLQRSLAYPRLEAGFIYNPQNSIAYAGTYSTIVLPVFDRNQGERKKSLYLVSQSQTLITYKELQIRKEIQTEYNSYLGLKKSSELCQNVDQKAKTILTSVLYSYLKKYTSIIDFIYAQKSYSETKRMCLQNTYQYRATYIKLLYETGIITDF